MSAETLREELAELGRYLYYFPGQWVDLDERKRPKSVPRLSSPVGLFIYVQNVDKAVAEATSLGATGQGPVMDMFWGDRSGTIVDPNRYTWMVGTHKAEPTATEMKEKMLEKMRQQPAGTASAA
jgi:hypothetical protein